MRKILVLLLTPLLLFFFSFPSYAEEEKVKEYYYNYKTDHAGSDYSLNIHGNGYMFYYTYMKSDIMLYMFFDAGDQPYSVKSFSQLYPSSTAESIGNIYTSNKIGGLFAVSDLVKLKEFSTNMINLGRRDEWLVDGNPIIPYDYLEKIDWKSLPEYGSGGTEPDIPDEGGNKSEIMYNSEIPSPQNLQFKASAEGGVPIVHIGGKNYHTLTWTNVGIDDLAVRISAVVVATDNQQNSTEKELFVCSDGSDGSSTGYRASNKFFKYNFTDFWDTVASETGYGLHMESMTVKQYRVQFYRYVEGKQHVGPIGVIAIKRNGLGVYNGHTVTTEIPLIPEFVGPSGGLYPSDSGGNWSSEDQPYVDYDSSGNQTGTGTVGKGEDPTGNGNVLGTIQDILSGLLNIPTVISQFFKSILNLMSGIGQLPALFGRLFAFLPSDVITVVSIGVVIVIVLRILGR